MSEAMGDSSGVNISASLENLLQVSGVASQVFDVIFQMIDAIYDIVMASGIHHGLSIYCDYGMREVLEMESRSIVDQDWMIDPLLMKMLEENPHFKGRIRSRNGLALTIKPLTERRRRLEEINEVLERFHGRFKARIAGSTSIDVLPVQCSKMTTLMKIAERRQISLNHVLYVGNELLNEEGNDWCIARMGVQTFNVRGIEEFNNLIRIWTRLGKSRPRG